jgi:Predicted membrane protein (DUF2254)
MIVRNARAFLQIARARLFLPRNDDVVLEGEIFHGGRDEPKAFCDFHICAGQCGRHEKCGPGQFILRGEPLACVWPPNRIADFDELIERHVGVGRHRSLKQECEFGIAQIVEIAIRALSPTVNDIFCERSR